MKIELRRDLRTAVIDGHNRKLITITPFIQLRGGIYGEIRFPTYEAFADQPEDEAAKTACAMENANRTLQAFLANPECFQA